jgi:hypothetical protein
MKAKPKQAEPPLGEILSGVDIIGTILHTDLPRLEKQLAEIRSFLAPDAPAGRLARRDTTDVALALEEIKEQLQVQGQRLLSLEHRLVQLTALFDRVGRADEESS